MAKNVLTISAMIRSLNEMSGMICDVMEQVSTDMKNVSKQLISISDNVSQSIASLKVKPSETVKHINPFPYEEELSGGMKNGEEKFMDGFQFKSLADGSVQVTFKNISHGNNDFPDACFAVKVGEKIYKMPFVLSKTPITERTMNMVVPVSYGDIINIGWWGKGGNGSEGRYIYELNIPVGGVSICYDLDNIVEDGGFTPIFPDM